MYNGIIKSTGGVGVAGGGTLAATGSPVLGALLLGAVALVGGLLLLRVSLIRRHSS
jgi:hypothetical protein